jgi:hypothetical protein
MTKMGFESIMVTSPFFDVSRFVFQKSPAQRPKWTFIWTLYTLPSTVLLTFVRFFMPLEEANASATPAPTIAAGHIIT